MKLQALLLVATVASALPKPGYVVHEKRFTDTGLRRGNRVDAGAVTTFRIGLKQGNLAKGYDYLMSVSHPSSSNYGKHWTADEVRKAFAPSAESIEAVQEWLTSYGIARGTEERGYLSIEIPVADAERLFAAKYYEHEDHDTGDIRIGCDEYAAQAI
jgi:tripeptidyl-peptidase-1